MCHLMLLITTSIIEGIKPKKCKVLATSKCLQANKKIQTRYPSDSTMVLFPQTQILGDWNGSLITFFVRSTTKAAHRFLGNPLKLEPARIQHDSPLSLTSNKRLTFLSGLDGSLGSDCRVCTVSQPSVGRSGPVWRGLWAYLQFKDTRCEIIRQNDEATLERVTREHCNSSSLMGHFQRDSQSVSYILSLFIVALGSPGL